MSAYWTLAQIIARLRQNISLPATWQISDAELTARINDFYQSRLPIRLKPDEVSSVYRFQTVGAYQIATGNGITKIFSGTLSSVPGVCGVGFSDSVETFKSQEDGTLLGTLGGTGMIVGAVYSLHFKTAPMVNAQIGVYYDTYTLPDNVVTVSAPLVVAGYPCTLVEDVETFWSHWPQYQPYYMGGSAPPEYMPSLPQEVLNYDGRLTMRPVPDQPYLFECASVLKPAALSASVNPIRDIWGPYIAVETAYEYLLETGDDEGASSLEPQRALALSDAMTPVISRMMNQRAKGRF